jgi:expansin (peptidoglycan-binding protein)
MIPIGEQPELPNALTHCASMLYDALARVASKEQGRIPIQYYFQHAPIDKNLILDD